MHRERDLACIRKKFRALTFLMRSKDEQRGSANHWNESRGGNREYARGRRNDGESWRSGTTERCGNERNEYGWKHDTNFEDPKQIEVEKPNFELSGLLAEEQNQLNGVALTFSIPPDSLIPQPPTCDWRLYAFKGEENTSVHKLWASSCFLLGVDDRLLEAKSESGMHFIPLMDSSCSKQHAVIQFRKRSNLATPYLLDLNSTNRTFLNGSPLESGRYVELRDQDVVKFGVSDWEFVLMDASTGLAQ